MIRNPWQMIITGIDRHVQTWPGAVISIIKSRLTWGSLRKAKWKQCDFNSRSSFHHDNCSRGRDRLSHFATTTNGSKIGQLILHHPHSRWYRILLKQRFQKKITTTTIKRNWRKGSFNGQIYFWENTNSSLNIWTAFDPTNLFSHAF